MNSCDGMSLYVYKYHMNVPFPDVSLRVLDLSCSHLAGGLSTWMAMFPERTELLNIAVRCHHQDIRSVVGRRQGEGGGSSVMQGTKQYSNDVQHMFFSSQNVQNISLKITLVFHVYLCMVTMNNFHSLNHWSSLANQPVER